MYDPPSHYTALIQNNQRPRLPRRRRQPILMLGLTGLMTFLALVPLFWIIGYVIYNGAQYINLDFFTQLPRPVGMAGRWRAARHPGHISCSPAGSLVRHPAGVLAAFYVARNPNTPLGIAVRFSTDVLAGVPSIVVGLLPMP